MKIVRCVSCDGYGWLEDEWGDDAEECDWCGGVGYVYRDANGIDQRISPQQLLDPHVSVTLEALETERMRELGYQGAARKPWEQEIRRGTAGGVNPYEDEA